MPEYLRKFYKNAFAKLYFSLHEDEMEIDGMTPHLSHCSLSLSR